MAVVAKFSAYLVRLVSEYEGRKAGHTAGLCLFSEDKKKIKTYFKEHKLSKQHRSQCICPLLTETIGLETSSKF